MVQCVDFLSLSTVQASDIIAGLSRASDFASLVLVAYITFELYTLFMYSTQRECTIVLKRLGRM